MPDAQPYQPTDEERKAIAEVEEFYTNKLDVRRRHEGQWFLNAAFLRGQQYVEWQGRDFRLTTPPAPRHRVRLAINRILPKVRARRARFLRNRPVPEVVPAGTTLRHALDARGTKRALDYQYRRGALEGRYLQALLWAEITSRGFWWFHWNESALAKVRQPLPDGSWQVIQAPLGDVEIEAGSMFEVLVADASLNTIADQPAIMRLKIRHVDDLRARFPEKGIYLTADTTEERAFDYERRVGTLSTTLISGLGLSYDLSPQGLGERGKDPTHIVVKELFERPSAHRPQGQYCCVAGGVLLRGPEPLPYGFSDMANPYPCVSFVDLPCAGQFYGTTLIEQLIGLQREYNLLRSKLSENLRLTAHPKLLAAKQHQIPSSSWTSEAGEIVYYWAIPGVPPPTPWHPLNIATDVWQTLGLLQREFEDLTQIFPSSEGRVGAATSGFQTNLLQEATDSIHQPEVRQHELAMEDGYLKIRRLMKLGYATKRLITVMGDNRELEAQEFSAEDIDENAEIRIQMASALPDLKGARINAVIELFKMGLLGSPEDPDVRRRALSMIQLGGHEEAIDLARRDEDAARLETQKISEDVEIDTPQFYDNHRIHYGVHTDQLKSPETATWPPERRLRLIAHTVLHMSFLNPEAAATVANEYGLQGLVPEPPPPPAPASAQAPSPSTLSPQAPLASPPEEHGPESSGAPLPPAGPPVLAPSPPTYQ